MIVEESKFATAAFCQVEAYREGAQDLIRRLVPSDLLEAPSEESEARVRFNDLLPILQPSPLVAAPCSISFAMLCKYRQNACQFFYDMIGRWLLPHQRANIELFFCSDIRLPHLSEDLLSVSEIVIHVKSTQELEEIRRNLQQTVSEIRLGVVSHYHAQRILEFKGLSNDGKTAMIQEKIGSLIQSRSKDFDRGIFSQMQQFLVNSPEDFKKNRDYHHISRIISNLYSVSKLLKQNIEVLPTERHLILKFLKTRIESGQAEKPVLGILASLNFLREHEVFETRHLVDAISQFLPNVVLVEGSSFTDLGRDSRVQTNYLEIEKVSGADFTHEEIQLLRVSLPDYLKSHIEQLAHPIFMPRNEEEVLRNIMVLSRQLRFVTDMPQVIISFDEQRLSELCFTVIVLRVTNANSRPMGELFAQMDALLKVSVERVRRLGSLGRKHMKEASVLRVSLDNDAFLRPDHSLDLYKARQFVLSSLSNSLGELRDYNGGMIGKQNELISRLKNLLGKSVEQNTLFFEKFFYSLAPVELRGVMEADPLKQLFSLLLQAQKHARRKLQVRQEAKRVFAVLSEVDTAFFARLKSAIDKLKFPPYQLISCWIESAGSVGYILESEQAGDRQKFLQGLESLLA